MKTKFLFLVLLASVVLLAFALAAVPAFAASSGLPQLGTPDVAHVSPDGSWFSGGNGWAGYADYPPGTPIPAQDSVSVHISWADPNKSLIEGLPQFMLHSVTVKAPGGDVVAKMSEEQSAQFWSKVAWDPSGVWYREWHLPLGQLPAGTYDMTFVIHMTWTHEGSVLDENGNWVTVLIKAYKVAVKSSFTVQ